MRFLFNSLNSVVHRTKLTMTSMTGTGEAKPAAGMLIYRFTNEFQYLLLQTAYGGHHWTPPKGHLDPGEDNLKAAYRETEEEAGLSPDLYEIEKDIEPIVLKYPVKKLLKTVTYWVAKLKDPDTPIKLSSEHQDMKWANVSEAIALTHTNQGDAIQSLDKILKERFNTKH